MSRTEKLFIVLVFGLVWYDNGIGTGIVVAVLCAVFVIPFERWWASSFWPKYGLGNYKPPEQGKPKETRKILGPW